MLSIQRLVLASALLLWLIPSIAQPPAGEVNLTDAQGRKQGTWTKTWPNGKTRYMGQFRDDKPWGSFRHYSEDGKLATVQEYAPDGVTSRATHYHPNGQVMARGKYVGQQKDSTWNYFDEAGIAQSVERYKQGKLDGERVVYYDNGQIAELTTFKLGVQHGPWKQFFMNGTPKAKAEFVNGEPEGTMSWFYPDGGKEIEGKVVNGQRDGVWIYYNEDNSIQLTMAYTMGELANTRYMNGSFKEYYDDDQLKLEVTYKDGKKNGPFKEYYPNGKQVKRTVPGDPNMGIQPEEEIVWDGQVVKRTGTYKNDQLDGEVKEMAENGSVTVVQTWAAGQLISQKP